MLPAGRGGDRAPIGSRQPLARSRSARVFLARHLPADKRSTLWWWGASSPAFSRWYSGALLIVATAIGILPPLVGKAAPPVLDPALHSLSVRSAASLVTAYMDDVTMYTRPINIYLKNDDLQEVIGRQMLWSRTRHCLNISMSGLPSIAP